MLLKIYKRSFTSFIQLFGVLKSGLCGKVFCVFFHSMYFTNDVYPPPKKIKHITITDYILAFYKDIIW